MKRYLKIVIVSLALLPAVSCKSQYELLLASIDADEKYEAAFNYFDKKKYNKAAALFESLSVLTEGTERDDTVRYYLGLSNYRQGDYYTAEAAFQRFIEVYPRSPLASDARFLRLDCLYRSTLRYELDQSPTYTALNAITEYLREDPDNAHLKECEDMIADLNERLDRKAYEGAKLYYRMEDYLAARVALKNVLKDDSDNIYREDILYYTAMASYRYASLSVPARQKERYLVFVDDYLNFIGEYPDSPLRKDLEQPYSKAQKYLKNF